MMTINKVKILNLGAGNRIIEGADNHDIITHRPEINMVWDLNRINGKVFQGWFQGIKLESHYDKIEFISVIEHLEITPIQALNQCWNLLKPNGILIVKYPHHTSSTAHTDPTHRWFLNEQSLEYVDPSTQYGEDYNYYTNYKWTILTPRENRLIVKGGNRINVKLEMRPIKG